MKVRIKSGECPSYLTMGKVYDVVEFDENTHEHGVFNDNNWHTWISINSDDIHLNGGSWEIVDE